MLRERRFFGRTTPVFTLQWHLTDVCRFQCRHCYGTAGEDELSVQEAFRVLGEVKEFCRRTRVTLQVCLTGGDPLCAAAFESVYRALADARVPVSILGNPIPPAEISRLLAVCAPQHYQVSLEGLRPHNDAIRGDGHYDQTLAFLHDARRLGLRTHVMLTLTRDNADQVIDLGHALRLLTRRFTFNRLAEVGRGAALEGMSAEALAAFMPRYLAARRGNPVLAVKDNLLNVSRHHAGRPLFPGCTGHGCGAAFDFVALLPNGDVHACRKFPSLIGNVRRETVEQIYRSEAASRYRRGPSDCRGCPIAPSCRGCMAVTHGRGLDPLVSRDPGCFIHTGPTSASDGPRRGWIGRRP